MYQNTSYTQDNELVRACYDLPLGAKRLLVLAISKLDATRMPQHTDITVTAQDWRTHINGHGSTWDQLKRAADALFEAEVVVPTRSAEYDRLRWVQKCCYRARAGSVKLKFTNEVETYLTNLQYAFTRILIEEIAELQSHHAMRLYELLSQYRDTKWLHLSVDELRTILCLEDKYPRYAELKRNVIDKAIVEINASIPMTVIYTTQKKGRKVQALRFTFSTTIWRK